MIELHPGTGITQIRDGQFAWLRSVGPAPTDSAAAITVDNGRIVLNVSRDGNQGIRAGVGSHFSRISVRGDVTVQIGSVDEPYPAPAPNSTVELAPGSSVTLDAGAQVIAVGHDANGSASTAAPVLAAGSDGAAVRSLHVQNTGNLYTIPVGAVGVGNPPATNPVLTAGIDIAGPVHSLLTDTSGRQIVVGAAADGAAPVGASVAVGGVDASTGFFSTFRSGSGALCVGGGFPEGHAGLPWPVIVGGASGGAPRSLSLAASNALYTTLEGTVTHVSGERAVGVGTYGAPVEMGGVDAGGLVREVFLDTSGRLAGIGSSRKAGRKCYAVPFTLGATAGPLVSIEAPVAQEVVIRKIVLLSPGAQTTPALRQIQVARTVAPGVGGAITPYLHSGDAYAGICRSSVAGTLGALLLGTHQLWIPGGNGPFTPFELFNSNDLRSDGLVIPAGGENGIALVDYTGGAGADGFAAGLVFFDCD